MHTFHFNACSQYALETDCSSSCMYGTTFLNREEMLPSKPLGYYKEYTVPTPGIHSRGAQRIVTGQFGEMYYTPDHYNTFERIITK